MRGFARFLRDHQQRAAIPYAIDLEYFTQEHRDYVKLGLAPWAVNTKPPLLIRALWVERLVADFHRWHQELAVRYPSFYLAVWLYEPEFGRSQLVAGIEERQAWYEGLFNYDLGRALPAEYQSIPGVAALKWTASPEVVTYWPDEFAELGVWVTGKPHWETKTADGKSFFVVQIGIVWVGEAAD